MSEVTQTRDVESLSKETGEARWFSDLPDAVLLLQPDGRLLLANPAARRLLASCGLSGEISTLPWKLVAGSRVDIPLPGDRFAEALVAETVHQGRPALVAVLRDLTDRKVEERRLESETRRLVARSAELEQTAQLDPLTGVLNRRGLTRVLDREAMHSRRIGSSICALLVDIDDFKSLNEQYGHAFGDRVLACLARLMESQLRPLDHVARVGGDEFLIILPDTRWSEGVRIADRLRRAAEQEVHELGSLRARATISIGVSRVPFGERMIEKILIETREALRQCKTTGKNTVGVSSRRGPSGTLRTWRPDERLQSMTDVSGLRMVSQPIVRLATGGEIGREYFARGPLGTFELPGAFLRTNPAEAALRAADLECIRCGIAASADTVAAGLRVHLNVLPSTLEAIDVEAFVGLFPADRKSGAYCIEISEARLTGDAAGLRDKVRELRSAGFRLALDDIGFGRGAMESLIQLEPDMIKLDRRWIGVLDGDPATRRALQRLVRAASALGADTAAVGLGDLREREILVGLGILYGQGFFFGPVE